MSAEVQSTPSVESSRVDHAAQRQSMHTASVSGTASPAKSNLVEKLARGIAEKLTENVEENVDMIRRALEDVEQEFLMDFRSASQSIAASELVTSPENWEDWARSIKLYLFSSCRIQAVSSKIEEIASDVRYPKELQTLDLPHIKNRTLFTNTIQGWASKLSADKVEAATGQRPLSDALFFAWSCTKNAIASDDNEAVQCVLADAMIRLIFSQSDEDTPDEDRCTVFVEKDIALPRPQRNQDEVKSPVSARPHILSMKKLPVKMVDEIEHGLVHADAPYYLVHCLLRVTEAMYLGVFPVESKCLRSEDARRQVAMDLSSIQYQRRALSLKAKPVYGATVVNGLFQLVACVWVDDNLWVMPAKAHPWNLVDPIEFIECLYFMSNLKKHIDEEIGEDFQSFNRVKFVAYLRGNWRYRPDHQSNKRREEAQDDKKRRRLNDDQVRVDADLDADMGAFSDASDGYNTEPLPSPPRNPVPFNFLKALESAMERNRKRASRIASWRVGVPPQSGEDIQISDDDEG